MMLRTFAALSLGTLAATTSVASIASTAERGADDASPRPELVPSTPQNPVAAKSSPKWRGTAAGLVEAGVLEDLAQAASRLTNPVAREIPGVATDLRPAIVVPKKPNRDLELVYDLDGNIALTGRIHSR